MTYAMNQIKYRAKNLLFPVKKRLIKKFGRNLIPLYFWLVSLTFYRTFYIFNVDFFLPGILFLRFVEFLLMGWLIFDPFSKACHTRELIMMKNSLPIMFILTCIFSQHYFYISLLIFATILLISIISCILLYRESKRHSQYNKRRIRIKPVFQRIFIVTSVVLLLVPSVWGIFLLNNSTHMFFRIPEVRIRYSLM